MLLGLNLPLTCGLREPFPALVQPCWQCPSCTLYHRPDHSINGQFLYSPETNLNWGHTLYSIKLENRAVVSLCLHYHTRLSGGTWKQKKPQTTGLCKKAIIPSGKLRQTRQVVRAQDKRAFQAGDCQHCCHPLVWNNHFFLSYFAPWFQKKLPHGFSKGHNTFFSNFLLSKHFFTTQLST